MGLPQELAENYPNNEFTIALTGSGAMSAANFLDLPFIQEVVAWFYMKISIYITIIILTNSQKFFHKIFIICPK
mgnify:CR=1 FL=1